MDCEKFKNIAFELAAGELSEEERAEAELHMSNCRSCREEYEENLRLIRAFRSMGEAEAPADLLDNVMKNLPKQKKRLSPTLIRFGSAAAAAVVLIAGAVALRPSLRSGGDGVNFTDESKTQESTDPTAESSASAEPQPALIQEEDSAQVNLPETAGIPASSSESGEILPAQSATANEAAPESNSSSNQKSNVSRKEDPVPVENAVPSKTTSPTVNAGQVSPSTESEASNTGAEEGDSTPTEVSTAAMDYTAQGVPPILPRPNIDGEDENDAGQAVSPRTVMGSDAIDSPETDSDDEISLTALTDSDESSAESSSGTVNYVIGQRDSTGGSGGSSGGGGGSRGGGGGASGGSGGGTSGSKSRSYKAYTFTFTVGAQYYEAAKDIDIKGRSHEEVAQSLNGLGIPYEIKEVQADYTKEYNAATAERRAEIEELCSTDRCVIVSE